MVDAYFGHLPDIVTIISVMASVTGLAGYIRILMQDMKKRSDAKAEEKAKLVREQTDHQANEIKAVTEKTALELKAYTDERWQRNHTDIKDILDKVNSFSQDLSEVSKRQDLVNGNVANIRTDVLDLQEAFHRRRTKSTKEKRRMIEEDRVKQERFVTNNNK